MSEQIFRVNVREVTLPEKLDWLSDYDDKYKDEDFKEKTYDLYFPTYFALHEKVEQLTKGFNQYFADVYDDYNENPVENLEYHNSRGEWDKEIHIEISRLCLVESLLESINEVKQIQL